MQYEEWAPFYAKIAHDFGFDMAADDAAARGLAAAISLPPYDVAGAWKRLESAIQGRDVIVLGAADDAAQRLKEAAHGGRPVVAADGATSASLEAGVTPLLIVSDLDGNLPDEVRAVEQGSLILVHAHGDNVGALREWLPRFRPERVAGTCQGRPPAPLRNYGGFTDGDRACFIAHALGARSLRLVGFRFTGTPGRYTGTFDPATKPRKLQWAQRMLRELEARGAIIENV